MSARNQRSGPHRGQITGVVVALVIVAIAISTAASAGTGAKKKKPPPRPTKKQPAVLRTKPLLPAALAATVGPSRSAKASPAKNNPAKASPAKTSAATPKSTKQRMVWTCGQCHVPDGWRVIPERVDFDHDRTGVPLSGAHAVAACVGCHKRHPGAATAPKGRQSGPKAAPRVPRNCTACHQDTHRGEQGRRCEACHTSRSWKMPRRFDDHASGRFPLSGVHAMVACASCHRGQGRDRFRGTPTTCDACHKTRALGVVAFDHRPLRMGCNQCHSTFGWAPARFNHGVFWPLQGSHAAIAQQCSKCHNGGSYNNASRACVSCHRAKIDDAKTHPNHRTIGLVNTCERCHTATSWQALKPTWHDPAFPLTSGNHRRYATSCSSCHPAGIGKGRFDCINCHDGEHSKARTDKKHVGEVSGYVYQSAACFNCHPRGSQ